ncbi:MAG: hypothetical protein NWF14_03060 [Candidatus Bathyarchaeota archaeon]|nr:hypothetical protein [Candidatus Bathyarchaeota archaeon]
MMGRFVDLYKLKIKIFVGALKSSKINMILVALAFLGPTPGSIGMAMTVVNLVKGGIDLTVYVPVLSAIISGLLAMVLASTFRGFVVFEYEQNLIFTSTTTPLLFMAASALADITAFSIFALPLILFLGVITVSLALPVISALSIVVVFLSFIFILFFLKNSLSILESTHPDSSVRIVTVILIVFLLLPAIGLFTSFPLRYGLLPYPSTLLAQAVLHALYGRLPQIESLLGLGAYFIMSLVLFLHCSKKNLFRFAKPIPFVSPFDTSMRTQTAKMGQNIKIFSRVGLRVTLDLRSKSLLRFLMKKEFVRMIRDGSLFVVLLFYLIVSIMTLVTKIREAPFPVWLLILAIYSFIVPAILISNWRVSELYNLWIPLTSAVDLGCVVKALLYDFTLIASVVPAVTIALLTFVSQINPLIPLVMVTSVSLIGCSANLFVMMSFLGRKRRGTPSFMIGWVSMLLSGMLISPIYIYVTLSFIFGFTVETNLLFSGPLFAYSALVFWFLSKRTYGKALSIEI